MNPTQAWPSKPYIRLIIQANTGKSKNKKNKIKSINFRTLREMNKCFFFVFIFAQRAQSSVIRQTTFVYFFFCISEPSPVSYMYGSMMNLFMHIFTMRMCGFEVNFCVVQMVFNSTAPSNTITSQPPKNHPLHSIYKFWECGCVRRLLITPPSLNLVNF